MHRKCVFAVACLVCACGACGAEDPRDAQDPADDSVAEEGSFARSPDVAELRERVASAVMSEPIGETAEPSTQGDACRAYCGVS